MVTEQTFHPPFPGLPATEPPADPAAQPVQTPPAPPPAPLGILDAVYGVITRPAQTLAAAAESPPYGTAVLLVAVVSVLQALAAGPGAGAITRGLTNLALGLLGMALLAAGLGLLAELLGGRGRATTLFALLGLAKAPALVLLPLQVLGRASGVLAGLAGVAGFFWGLVMAVLAVRAAYRTESGVAIATVAMGIAALVLIPIMVIVMALIAIASDPTLTQSMQNWPR